jgi:hypothetical protein
MTLPERPRLARPGEKQSLLIPGMPAELPSIRHAKLPAIYEAAKTAIAECAQIDECKDWADKAEALASYARQADDDSLRRMADRIQGRAVRRCGELIREIAPRDGTDGRPKKGNGGVTLNRDEVAEDAGLSLRQKRTALRVANVPEAEFEELIESEDPPTVTQLAEYGKKPAPPPSLAHLKGRDPEDFKVSTAVQGGLRLIAELAEETKDLAAAVRGAYEHERPAMASRARAVIAWLNKLLEALEALDGSNPG